MAAIISKLGNPDAVKLRSERMPFLGWLHAHGETDTTINQTAARMSASDDTLRKCCATQWAC